MVAQLVSCLIGIEDCQRSASAFGTFLSFRFGCEMFFLSPAILLLLLSVNGEKNVPVY